MRKMDVKGPVCVRCGRVEGWHPDVNCHRFAARPVDDAVHRHYEAVLRDLVAKSKDARHKLNRVIDHFSYVPRELWVELSQAVGRVEITAGINLARSMLVASGVALGPATSERGDQEPVGQGDWSGNPAPEVKRCTAIQPHTELQCGLVEGHEGTHTTLIPTGVPWGYLGERWRDQGDGHG